MDAKSADEAFRVLNDHPLISDHIDDLKVGDYQKVLSLALKSIQKIIHEMAPHKEVMNFLWYKYDFHNLKIVLKARLTEHGYADIQHALIDAGLYGLENWEKALFEGKSLDLISGTAFAIKEATELYEKSKNPQIIDLIIDQYYLNELNRLAQEMDSSLVITYVSRLIDITNARTFIRCKELKEDRSHLEKFLIKGGSVYPDLFVSAYDKGYDELRIILEKRPHMSDLAETLDIIKKEKSLLSLETKILENIQNFMKESQRESFGPEPVFAFFYKFENHLQILRTVLIGKLNKLEVKDIATSLPAL